jgi:ATP-dependent DNA helicase RecG
MLALKKVAAGEVKIIVSTHAVLYSQIEYNALGLAITDEQQRFGVAQRASIQPKSGESAHILVMSATPIPRTLSLILHGDLDVSVLDEMPRDRKKILTYHITSEIMMRALRFTKDQLCLGRQAYVVCPLIESEAISDIQQAVELKESLTNGLFSDCKVELLHGKMLTKEKEIIMSRFVAGEIDLLVTTSIVEVGVDVPNATVMMIQNAERFGLSQLHQLRGRVGRGKHQSYCILISDAKGEIAKKRMEVLVRNQDGFLIAEQDLLLRGAGDLLGLRQHGITQMFPDYVFANKELLMQVNMAADEILASDPQLISAQNKSLQEKVFRLLNEVGEALN